MRYTTAALVTGGRTGHRFKDQVTARIAAELFNLKYVHLPFPRDAWEEDRWEEFLGFGDDEISIHNLDFNGLEVVRIDTTAWCGLDLTELRQKIDANTNPNVLFLFTESARIVLEQLDKGLRDSIVSTLRKKYWNRRLKDPVTSYFNSGKLNVAMHLRRGADVAPGAPASWRSTANDYYLKIIKNLREVCGDKLEFHLYSEGEASEFTDFRDVSLHLCPWPPKDYRDLFTSFHHLVTADILVTATSEFSYLLAHINPNCTITLPVQNVCKLPNESRHLIATQDGKFDANQLTSWLGSLKAIGR